MKKWVASIIALCIVFGLFSAGVSVKGEEYSFGYELNDAGQATITKFYGSADHVEIPAKMNGYPVTAIGHHAFEMRSIQSVTIPKGVTVIESNAFNGCPYLTQVVLPEGLKVLQDYAFSGCSDLTTISLPSSLTEIGAGCFYSCESLTEAIVLPNSMKKIPPYLFYDCENLTQVTFASDITQIGEYAFAGTKIAQISLPDSVTKIGKYAFSSCKELTEFTFPKSITTVSEGLLEHCEKLTKIHFSSAITRLESECFWSCSGLTELTLPDSITFIGANAFGGCWRLHTLVLPSKLEVVDEYGFSFCNGLVELHLPASVRSIGQGAFAYSRYFQSITVDAQNPWFAHKDGVLYNKDMTRLIYYPIFREEKNFSVPEGVTTIEQGAFFYDEGLCENEYLKTLHLPSTVQEIPLFYSNLTSITVAENNPYFADQNGVLFTKDEKTLLQYPSGRTEKEYHVPSTVEHIGVQAFYTSWNLQAITFPEGLKTIGAFAFVKTAAKQVHFPKSLESLGEGAFSYASVEEVVIPSGNIGEDAFQFCDKLTSLTVDNATLGESAFLSCGLQTVILTDGVKGIDENTFRYCYGISQLQVPENDGNFCYEAFLETVIAEQEGTWDGPVFYWKNCAMKAQSDISGSYSILPGTVRIANAAFYRCKSLSEVIIPGSVVSIGTSAFLECSQLHSVILQNGIEHIGGSAFRKCYWLGKLHLPASVKTVGSFFLGTDSISQVTVDANNPYFCTVDGVLYTKDKKELVLFPANHPTDHFVVPSSVTTIRHTAFTYRTQPLSVVLSEGVTTLEMGAFLWCDGLEEIYIPATVTSMGEACFESCYGLKRVWIDAKVVAEDAFLWCQELEEVVLGPNVEILEENSFAGCTSLVNMYVPATVTQIGSNALDGAYGFTLYGEENSAVHRYAMENDIPFVVGTLPQSPLPNQPGCYGDVSLDGNIDALDALLILQYAVGRQTLASTQLQAAEVSGDNTINAVDALLVLQYAVNKISSFPIE